jgi:hypothetical protein
VLFHTHKDYIVPIKKFLRDSIRLIDLIANTKDIGCQKFETKANKYIYDYHQVLAKENILI